MLYILFRLKLYIIFRLKLYLIKIYFNIQENKSILHRQIHTLM